MRGNTPEDTKPERQMQRLLRENGYGGYRLHWKKAPGTPDIAYPGRRIAIFVNGCFWHRCPHCRPPLPKSHSDFWYRKFLRNQERDARKVKDLESTGWHVLTVWECELNQPREILKRLQAVWTRRPTDAPRELDGGRAASSVPESTGARDR